MRIARVVLSAGAACALAAALAQAMQGGPGRSAARLRPALLADRVVLGALAAPSTGATGNLLKNPSFEQRSGPRRADEKWGWGYLDGVSRSPFAHWGYGGFWDGGDYDIRLGPGHAGRLSARLVCREKGRGGLCSEVIAVSPGTRLRFRGFFKAVGARGGACFVNFEGEPGDGWAKIPLPDKSDYDWQEVAGEVTVPAPGKKPGGQVQIVVFIYTKAYGELWIDDVSLVPGMEGRDPG
jgi:hypothetical protein